jgi:hypothetical protein
MEVMLHGFGFEKVIVEKQDGKCDEDLELVI